jgi:hypothetical protein
MTITLVPKLTEALIKAQGKFEKAVKDHKNDHFGSRYADLASVLNACRDALNEEGLAVVQTVERLPEGGCFLRSTLLHTSGEQISSEYPVCPVKPDPQALGSAVTYARRYSLMALVGIAPEDDDDGNAASGRDQGGRHDRAQGSQRSTQGAPQGNGQQPRQQSAPAAPTGSAGPSTSKTPPASTTRAASATTEPTAGDIRAAKAAAEQHRTQFDANGKNPAVAKAAEAAAGADPNSDAEKERAKQLHGRLGKIDTMLCTALWKATAVGTWRQRADTFQTVTEACELSIKTWGPDQGWEHIDYMRNEAGWPWPTAKDATPAAPEQVAKLIDLARMTLTSTHAAGAAR